MLDRLRDDDFTQLRVQFVVATVRKMLADGIAPDPVTLPAYVERHALLSPGLARKHLRSLLYEMTNAAPVVASIGHYADAVIHTAARRRMVEAGQRYIHTAYGDDLDALPEVARREYLAVADAFDRCGIAAEAVSTDA